MDKSINGHSKGPNIVAEWVWYEGVDALKEGEAVCYNTDYGVAASYDARRGNRVERPSTSNNMAFAGVAARSYPASSTGRLIEIYVPGSKGVKVALGINTVIGEGLLSFIAGTGGEAGRFYTGKYKGRGSVIPRQTKTAILEASMTGAFTVEAVAGIIVTHAAANGIAAGDVLVILAGENDATGVLVPGKYEIASITDATHFVLKSSALSTFSTGTISFTGYVYTGNPVCQADLLEGDECGGVEFICPPNAGLVGLAHMVGGVTYCCGGVTVAAAADVTFAQGLLPGDKKAFLVLGALATTPLVIDLVTASTMQIRTEGGALTALAEIGAMDAAGDGCFLEFDGATWLTQGLLGAAAEA